MDLSDRIQALERRVDALEAIKATPPVNGNRAGRGGCYWDGARGCRSAYRRRLDPGNRNEGQGFRPVAEAKEMEEEDRRVCRSTGWRWSSKGCRPAGRGAIMPEDRGVCLGFRLVAEAREGEERHVCRGSYWHGTTQACRSADRRTAGEGAQDDFLGFRPVAEVKGKKP